MVKYWLRPVLNAITATAKKFKIKDKQMVIIKMLIVIAVIFIVVITFEWLDNKMNKK